MNATLPFQKRQAAQPTQVLVESKGDVTLAVLTPPTGKPPTLDHGSLEEMEQVVTQLAAKPPRAVILKSSEPKYFCVGANIDALKDTTADSIVPWTMLGQRVFNALEDLPCPVVAQVSGYVMGGGLELAMACDLIFASTDARFAQSEAALGFIPGWGGTRRLVRRVGLATAKRLFYSGTTLDGTHAERVGLADVAVPGTELEETVATFVEAVRRNSPYAIATFKRIVGEEEKAARDRTAAQEALYSRGCLQDTVTRERLDRFLNKRK